LKPHYYYGNHTINPYSMHDFQRECHIKCVWETCVNYTMSKLNK
jgi:hypothetical protein